MTHHRLGAFGGVRSGRRGGPVVADRLAATALLAAGRSRICQR
jgi:hypothetical protein